MTTEVRASTPLVPLVRAVALPGLAVGAGVAVVALMIEGWGGLWGGLAGAVLVTAFFASGQVVLRAFKGIEPVLLLAIALMTYALQVVILIVLYAVFANSNLTEDQFSTKAFGLAVLAATGVWIIGLIRAAKRERIPLYDLEGTQP